MPRALGLVETRGLIGAIEAADAMVKAANVKLAGTEKTVPALITVKVLGDTAAVRSAVDAGAAAAERVGELYSTHIIPQPDEQLSVILPEIIDKERSREQTSKNKTDKSGNFKDTPKPEQTEKDTGTKPEKDGAKAEQKQETSVIKESKQKEEEKEPPADEQRKEELEDLFTERDREDTISRLKREALESSKKSKEKKKEERETGPAEIPDDLEDLNVHDLRKLARSIDNFPIKGREISKANRQELLDYFDQVK